MSCIGPMARTVEDLALLYALIAGPGGRDTEVAPVPVGDMPQLALKDLRIAIAPTFPGIPVAEEIRDAIEALAQQLGSIGVHVEEAALPAVDFTQDLRRAGNLIGMMTGAFQPGAGERPITLAEYPEVLDQRDASKIAWERFFENWDLLLCPPAMVTAFLHCEPGSPLHVDGQEATYWMVSAHGTVFNYTGHPAIVLPYNVDRSGLPIGVQLVGKRGDDSRLLAIALAFTEVTGGFHRPPGY